MVVRLFESLRAVFYTPFYLAIELDAYRAEGLDVRFGHADSPAAAPSALFDGHADVVWGGPMRMMSHLDSTAGQRSGKGVVAFAEAVTRDPFYLVGRESAPGFQMRDLCSARLATVSEVPTPWLCLQDDIRRAGLDPSDVDRLANQTMDENAELLRRGEVDVIQVFEPYVETLIHEGAGHLWYAASSRGPTSYTTLYTSTDFAKSHPDALAKLAQGMAGTLRWLHAHDAPAIAEKVGLYFPDLDRERLVGAIRRYLRYGVWGRDPRLPLEGYLRLKCALVSGGFIARDIPFEACVDNRFAENALRPPREN